MNTINQSEFIVVQPISIYSRHTWNRVAPNMDDRLHAFVSHDLSCHIHFWHKKKSHSWRSQWLYHVYHSLSKHQYILYIYIYINIDNMANLWSSVQTKTVDSVFFQQNYKHKQPTKWVPFTKLHPVHMVDRYCILWQSTMAFEHLVHMVV